MFFLAGDILISSLHFFSLFIPFPPVYVLPYFLFLPSMIDLLCLPYYLPPVFYASLLSCLPSSRHSFLPAFLIPFFRFSLPSIFPALLITYFPSLHLLCSPFLSLSSSMPSFFFSTFLLLCWPSSLLLFSTVCLLSCLSSSMPSYTSMPSFHSCLCVFGFLTFRLMCLFVACFLSSTSTDVAIIESLSSSSLRVVVVVVVIVAV